MNRLTGAPTDIPQFSGSGCRFCNGPNLRRSRFRAQDVPWLLTMQWPVRCLSCNKRQYALWPRARRASSSDTPHTPELRGKESWQNYTSAEFPGLRSDQHDKDKR
jgi:hypothetical protein